MKVSVLMTYYGNLAKQLSRTLWLLLNQTYPIDEIIILDDGGEALPDCLQLPENVFPLMIRPYGAPDRSPNVALNHGYKYCGGDYIILTGAEIMPPLNAVEMLLRYDGGFRQVPTQYAIDWPMYQRLDRVDWKSDVRNIETLPNFWATTTPWLYTNEHAPAYHNHISFCGQTRRDWECTNFIPDTAARGMNDSWLHMQEMKMHRPAIAADFAVYHQWHPRPGEMESMSMRIKRIWEMENA